MERPLQYVTANTHHVQTNIIRRGVYEMKFAIVALLALTGCTLQDVIPAGINPHNHNRPDTYECKVGNDCISRCCMPVNYSSTHGECSPIQFCGVSKI